MLYTNPPTPTLATSHSLLTHPQLCLVFIFLCHILLHCATLHFSPLSEVEVKSLKQSIGWARREQTQPQICLSCSGEGWGGGFLIKGFWILIWKGDGGSYKVKIKNKSFITLTFTRTEPPENKTLSLIVWRRLARGVCTKSNIASAAQGILTVFFYLSQKNSNTFLFLWMHFYRKDGIFAWVTQDRKSKTTSGIPSSLLRRKNWECAFKIHIIYPMLKMLFKSIKKPS